MSGAGAEDIAVDASSLPRVRFAWAGRVPPGHVYPETRHPSWVLDYIGSGSARWVHNARPGSLHAGHAYLYRPHDRASGRVDDARPLAVHGIVFDWSALGGRAGTPLAHDTRVRDADQPEFEAACMAVVEAFLDAGPGWELVAAGRLVGALGLLARPMGLLARPQAERHEQGGPLDRRLALAHAFMRRNLARGLRIGEVAAVARLSEPYFRAAFARRFGMPPVQYLIELRLRELRRLLMTEPAATIEDLSRRCGFGDAKHCTRLFKRRFGVAPEPYRRALPASWRA